MSSRVRAEDLPFEVPRELNAAWNRHPEIVKLGDPVLRQVAKPVTHYRDDTARLVERMKIVMRKASGLGLAAPQVGVSTRIIVYDVGQGIQVLVNPKILAGTGEQTEPAEGCLSIPGLQGEVARYAEVRIKAYNEHGKPVSRRAKEMEARVIQHEIDHLDGVLFYDRAKPETLEWVLGHDGDDEDAALRE